MVQALINNMSLSAEAEQRIVRSWALATERIENWNDTMAAAPKKAIKLDRKPPKLVVLFGPVNGTAPIANDEVDWLHPIRIERSIGGSRVSCVTFAYDLGKTKEQIVDTLAPKGVTRQVEVRELDEHGNPLRLLLWGKLASQPIDLSEDKQTVSYVVRIDRHLLGSPLTRTPFWNPQTNDVLDVDRPFVFNPDIDDIVKGNRSNKVDIARGSLGLFMDRAGPDTEAERTTSGQTASKWRIFHAVHCLCWLLNANETFVKNPTLEELESALGQVDATPDTEKLKNLKLTPGKFLTELLDELLIPFGCGWYIQLDLGGEDLNIAERRIKCFRRNQGPKKELWLQRPALPDADEPTALDPALSTLTKLTLNYDITNLANRIVGVSSLRQREVSMELYKIWPTSDDNLDREELETNAAMKKAHEHAGRMWAANESGAHTGLRPEITELNNFSSYFEVPTAPIARKLLPCLSRVQDNNSNRLESRGIVLHYSIDAGASWQVVSKWSWSNLEQQCGIYFDKIPPELWDEMSSPNNVRLRVTATIQGDSRLEQIATRRDTSPNKDDVPLYLDLSDKFHDRSVTPSSIYYAELTTADTAFDSGLLLNYVNQVRSIEDAAELSCSAELEGIDHPEYELGDLITRVKGLNLSLIRDNPAAGIEGKSLQVVGINLNVQENRTELLLETFDEEKLT